MARSSLLLSLTFLLAAAQPATQALAQTAAKPVLHQSEWVYRVKYGFQDEWWRLFQKYQIATLDELKRQGRIQEYQVYVPDLHVAEDTRWDYRIIVSYRDPDALSYEESVAQTLFPNKAQRAKDESRRWELTANHWDLPIHQIDPHAVP